MNFIKNQKGITMVYLIITIVVMGILSAIAISTINNSNDVGPYNKMIEDISLLEDKVLIYYQKNGEIPIIEDTEEVIDGKTYNQLDISVLQNITLNFGQNQETDDYYLIANNLEIYYKKGTEKSKRVYHTKNQTGTP